MEYVTLFKFLQEGGWLAILAFMAFVVYRQDKKLEKIEAKLDALKEDAVSRQDYYQDISGWRTEVREIDRKITQVLLALAKANQEGSDNEGA